jgi:hypothetical protein
MSFSKKVGLDYVILTPNLHRSITFKNKKIPPAIRKGFHADSYSLGDA